MTMKKSRPRLLAVAMGAYAAALTVLVATRLWLGWSNDGQALAAFIIYLVVLGVGLRLIGERVFSGRRSGRRAAANFAVLLLFPIAAQVVRDRLPTDWPLVMIGGLLLLFSLAQVAIDWSSQAEPSIRPPSY
jgi:hypothetical protein